MLYSFSGASKRFSLGRTPQTEKIVALPPSDSLIFDKNESVLVLLTGPYQLKKTIRLSPSEATLYLRLFHLYPNIVTDGELNEALYGTSPSLTILPDEQDRLSRIVTRLRQKVAVTGVSIKRLQETGYVLHFPTSSGGEQ